MSSVLRVSRDAIDISFHMRRLKAGHVLKEKIYDTGDSTCVAD